MRVAVSSSSALAADAGAQIGAEGGNAVDAALAGALVAATTEPGVTSLGGGGFVTIWPPGGDPVTIDGYAEMPGRRLPAEAFGHGLEEVSFPYGGGVITLVGHGSVATPGSPAALQMAHDLYGGAPWPSLFEPAIGYAREGFPMPPASYRYLITSFGAIYGHAERSVLGADGAPALPGTQIIIPGLEETLTGLASEGTDLLYNGDIATTIADDMEAHGGLIGLRDLGQYSALSRVPLEVEMDAWTLATNPPPAVGGATLAGMLLLAAPLTWHSWGPEETARMVEIQSAVLAHRRLHLDVTADLTAEVDLMLEAAATGDPAAVRSASTSHTSAVDRDGMACAATLSMGYGAGVVVPGTGLWLNNHLGELELNRAGVHTHKPGTRLSSNMAPTVARAADGSVMAIGSPGADRIATALLHVIVNHIKMGMDPTEAISAPRLHVEEGPEGASVAYEPGLPVEPLGSPARRFDGPDMFFGGVALAGRDSYGELVAASDARREGSMAYA